MNHRQAMRFVCALFLTLGFQLVYSQDIHFTLHQMTPLAFNPANTGKVVPEPIEGQSGVYVVRVDNLSATPVETADIDEQRRNLEMQMRQQMMYRNNPADVLKKAADIEDKRAKFY